jgi:cytochrome c
MNKFYILALSALVSACGGKPAEPSASTGSTGTTVAASTGSMPEAFVQCAVCHKVAKGEPNGVGPNLNGIVGAKAGMVAGYSYSEAMKAWGQNWTEANLDKYIINRRGLIAGTKMSYSGMTDPEQRKAVIEWLKQNK